VKAVVLAAGRGTRMRESEPGKDRGSPPCRRRNPELDPAQHRAAEEGQKGLIPFHGHPFLSHVLSALADGRVNEVCLVVGPGPNPVRAYFEALPTTRLRIRFAVQEHPTGSAHALLAAEEFAGGDPVLVVNGDNLYPPAVVERVGRIRGSGLAGFRASALSAGGAIPPERIAAFAVVAVDEEGCLREIFEKPGPEQLARLEDDPLVSMTCWRFEPEIFQACHRVGPSARGEYELPDAVIALVRGDGSGGPEGQVESPKGRCVQVVPVEAEVLDLTAQGDIPQVEARLGGREVRL
jgi:dTDP-glucose pyrophosphorylase